MTPQPKEKQILMPHYLKWGVNHFTCQYCGAVKTDYRDIVYAHQNFGYGKMAGKSHDFWVIFICTDCHAIEHTGQETFWQGRDRAKIILNQLKEYGQAFPEKVFWYYEDFYRILLMSLTKQFAEFLGR